MAVVSTSSYTTFTGNGVTVSFPFTFACRNVADVAVFVNGTLQNSGFSVTLNSDFNGGTVLFTSAPASGAVVIAASGPSFDQPIAFEDAGPYNPSTVDGAIDAAAIRDICIIGQIARAPLAPIGETLGPLPAKATRAGLNLGFNANGDPVSVNPGGADSALRADLAYTDAASGPALVNFTHSNTYPANTVGNALKQPFVVLTGAATTAFDESGPQQGYRIS